MKKLILILITSLGCISATIAENTSKQVDSLKLLLKTAPIDSNRVKSLNELSAYLIIDNKYDSALIFSNEALSLSERLNYQPGIASSYRQIGVANTQMGKYPEALDYLLKSFKNQDILSAKERILLHNNIGMIYYYQADYPKALEYFFGGINLIGNDALINENIGMVYLADNKIDLSLKYFNRSLSSYSASQDSNSVGRLLNSIGTSYEQKGEFDKALKYYKESLIIKNKIGDKIGITEAYASIGDALYKQGRIKESIEFENASLKMAKEIGYVISIQQTEEMLSNIYHEIGDNNLAFIHYKNYISIRDSLFNEETTKKTVRIEESYKYEVKKSIDKSEQDKKDAINMQKQENQKNIIYSISGGLVLCFILVFFIFRGYKHTKRAHIIISKQKELVDEKNKDILDSIQYASRIQKAILAPDNIIQKILPEHLIYFKPKDAVSGDFYFVRENENKIFWASCDATGHSVNGGMISMLSLNILEEIVKSGETIPSKILDRLNERFNESMHKIDDDSVRDGLDITLCSLDKNTLTLNFAAANNPLWIVRDGQILEYKADKMPIGQMYKSIPYTNNEIQLYSGDIVYSFSDGICDLHSEDNKKFMKKRLRELLLSIQNKQMSEQKVIISESLKNWKGNADQVDDMLIIGVKI